MRARHLVAIVIVIASLTLAAAGGWPRIFGSPGSVATDLRQDVSGDVWVAGRIQDAASSGELWVARLGSQGEVRWQRRLAAAGYQLSPRLAVAGDGAWVAAEVLRPQVAVASGGSLPASAAFVRRLDRDGKEVRRADLRAGRTNQPQALLGQADNGVLIAGETSRGDDPQSRGWLVRLEADGRVRWERVLPEVWWLAALDPLPDGRVLALGTAPGAGDEGRPWLGILTADGRVETSRTLDVVGVNAQAVLATADDFWVAGQQVPPPSPQAADDLGVVRRAWLVRVPRKGGAIRDVSLFGMRDAHALVMGGPGLIFVGGEGSGGLDPSAQEEPWVTIVDMAGGFVTRGRVEGTGWGELRALAATPDRVLGAGALTGRGAWVGHTLPAPMPARK